MKPIRAVVLGSAFLLPVCSPQIDKTAKTNNKAEIKTLLTGAVLSIPIGLQSGSKMVENYSLTKPAEVKSVDKNNLDEKRTVIEKKERDFAYELVKWTSHNKKLLLQMKVISLNRDEVFEAHNWADSIDIRSARFKALTDFDFSIKKPAEKQVRMFLHLIDASLKGDLITRKYSRELTFNEMYEKIEKRVKRVFPKLAQEKLKKIVEQILQPLKVYQETFKEVAVKKNDLYTAIKSFNNDAKKINEPPYCSVWGLGIKYLEDYLSIFDIKK